MTTLPPLVRAMVDASPDATAVVGPDLELLYYNAQYLALSGLRPRELDGRDRQGMCHEHFGFETCNSGCVSIRALESGRPIRVDEVVAERLGLKVILVSVPLVDGEGRVLGVLEQYRDVTAESRMQENYRRMLEQERAQKELLAAEVARQTVELEETNASLREALCEVSRMARTDGLTELANRRVFDEQLEAAVTRSREGGGPFSLVLIDLDFFKRVNDEHGHPTGDRLLKQFAAVLKQSCRPADLVARIGGEEFALLLPGANAGEAARVAARVQDRARSEQLLTTCSAGVAGFPAHARTGAELHRAADRALYAAKRGGRDRIFLAACLHDVRGSAAGAPNEAKPSDGGVGQKHVA